MSASSRASVSVALCTYNGAAFLEEQVASILAQTIPPDEIVLSDDGSSDASVDIIVRAVGDRVPLVVQVHSSALGVTANFESAIRRTTGDVIVLSDQDDVWHPDRIERGMERLLSAPAIDLVFSDARLIDGNGAAVGGTLIERLAPTAAERAALASSDLFSALLRRNLVTGATVMFRRRLLDVALPFPSEWVHDEWLAMLAAAVTGIAYDESPLIDYRLHGGNAIGMRAPTLATKIRRALEPDAGRSAGLARRAERLGERLGDLPSGDPAAVARREDGLEQIREKIALEERRARLSVSRWGRIPEVGRLLADGSYGRWASQGKMDAIRDLLQPRTHPNGAGAA